MSPVRITLAVLATWLVAACDSPPDADAGPGLDAGALGDGGAPMDAGAPGGCVGHAGLSADPTPWAIPDRLPASEVIDVRGSGEWIVLEVDGDGWIDLLAEDRAQLSWRLHRGGPSGFDATGERWAIPDAIPPEAVIDRRGGGWWMLVRADDDDVLDALAADPANLAWRLHRGGATGFDPVGTPWTVPDSFPVDTVIERRDPGRWALMDADGDGYLDALAADPGNLSWRLHRGGADGFDATGTSWTIPDGFPIDSVIDRSGSAAFAVLDVDGDGFVDALAANRGELGWRLHRGDADGFDVTGAPWRVPESLPVDAVADLSGSGRWTLTQADSDGVLDVLLADPAQLQWRLHRGGDGGFDMTGSPFPVPGSFPVAEVIDRSASGAWVVRDVDGDGLVDAMLEDRANLGWRWIAGACAR